MSRKTASQRRRERKQFSREKRRKERDRKAKNEEKARAPGRTPAAAFALDLVEAAMNTPALEGRLAMAREALRSDPDCADAYVLLARDGAESPAERIDLLTKGVEAGKRSLSEDVFETEEGNFWELECTRPYMRARLALARNLVDGGDFETAVGHLEELLRLNPSDDQQVRYLLSMTLIRLGRDEAAQEVLGRYPEDSTERAYLDALIAFRSEGDTPASRGLAKKARGASEAVSDLLVGRQAMPEAGAQDEEAGVDEAVVLVRVSRPCWAATDGALPWLESTLEAVDR